jgi:hypothetical protein
LLFEVGRDVYTGVVEPQHASIAADHVASLFAVTEAVDALSLHRDPDAHLLTEHELGSFAALALHIRTAWSGCLGMTARCFTSRCEAKPPFVRLHRIKHADITALINKA